MISAPNNYMIKEDLDDTEALLCHYKQLTSNHMQKNITVKLKPVLPFTKAAGRVE